MILVAPQNLSSTDSKLKLPLDEHFIILKTYVRISMKFPVDIHAPQRMKPNLFVFDPPTPPLLAPSKSSPVRKKCQNIMACLCHENY